MEKDDPKTNIYSKLREIRRSRGLTVHKLAEKIGENSQKVGRIERGNSNLTIDYLLKISKALNTPIDSILHDVPSKEQKQAPSEDPSILSEIVLRAEKLFQEENRKLKAIFISTVYMQALKFPPQHRKQFLNALNEVFLSLAKESQHAFKVNP